MAVTTRSGRGKQVTFEEAIHTGRPILSNETHLIRVIFNIKGVEHPHVLPRDQLFTSEFFKNKLRGHNGKPLPDLRLTFNIRDVAPMWHYWALSREIVYNYFSPDYVQLMERLPENQQTKSPNNITQPPCQISHSRG
jgi:hypothetical protein